MNVETHCHLGGCFSPQFIWDIINENGWTYLAENYNDVVKSMKFMPGEPYGFHRFLQKFTILDHIRWDENLLDRSIKDVCDSLESHKIDYVWMRFSISKYLPFLGWHKYEVVKFIHERFNYYRPRKVGLVLALKYESERAAQKQHAKLIERPDICGCLRGIDLVGDEAYFDQEFYRSLFKDWIKAKKTIIMHAGESQPSNNVRSAINIGAKHIAHGIKIIDNKYLMDYAKDEGICFDMALTSNKLTGVWDISEPHPIIEFLRRGIDVTISTDDPVQCSTTLDDEYRLLSTMVSKEEVDLVRRTAIVRTKKFASEFCG